MQKWQLVYNGVKSQIFIVSPVIYYFKLYQKFSYFVKHYHAPKFLGIFLPKIAKIFIILSDYSFASNSAKHSHTSSNFITLENLSVQHFHRSMYRHVPGWDGLCLHSYFHVITVHRYRGIRPRSCFRRFRPLSASSISCADHPHVSRPNSKQCGHRSRSKLLLAIERVTGQNQAVVEQGAREREERSTTRLDSNSRRSKAY